MSAPKEPYHYVECGLPNVFLLDGFDYRKTPYGKGVVIHQVDDLHACIGQTLVDKPGQLTGAEFRFLRRELDLSQRMIGEIFFGKDQRTIRSWETGEKELPKLEDALIRHIYKEKFEPSSTYADLIKRLNELDREWHEQLTFERPDSEWRAAAA